MKVAIGADHAGFLLKQSLVRCLLAAGYDVRDYGTDSTESADYPDFAEAVGIAVADGQVDRGVLVCYTGAGMSIAANKVPGVRATLGWNAEQVQLTREHNDANVLTLGAKFTEPALAETLLQVFLTTPFSEGERHTRRLAKIAKIGKE